MHHVNCLEQILAYYCIANYVLLYKIVRGYQEKIWEDYHRLTVWRPVENDPKQEKNGRSYLIFLRLRIHFIKHNITESWIINRLFKL